MPITLPNLPNLAGTNVTPNVPTHVLADTDITVVNSSATLGIGADRKVTLGELKASIVTPITDPIADTVSAITSKAIIVDLKDANGTTGVFPLDMAGYSCDLHVLVVNSTSAAPPVSPGYFTLQIANVLPAGATLHISGSIGGTTGTTLPVRVHFTSSYSQGLGELLYPYPAWVPLLNGGHFSAIVMYDGVTWRVDTTDLVTMDAYNTAHAARSSQEVIQANQYSGSMLSGVPLVAGQSHVLVDFEPPAGRYWFSGLVNVLGIPEGSGELYQAEIQVGEAPAEIGTVAVREVAYSSQATTLVIPGTLAILSGATRVSLVLKCPASFYQGSARTAKARASGFRISDY